MFYRNFLFVWCSDLLTKLKAQITFDDERTLNETNLDAICLYTKLFVQLREMDLLLFMCALVLVCLLIFSFSFIFIFFLHAIRFISRIKLGFGNAKRRSVICLWATSEGLKKKKLYIYCIYRPTTTTTTTATEDTDIVCLSLSVCVCECKCECVWIFGGIPFSIARKELSGKKKLARNRMLFQSDAHTYYNRYSCFVAMPH